MHTTLIQAPELRELHPNAADLAVFDCSFELSDPLAGARQFAQAHIPGARHADLERHLSLHAPEGAAAPGPRDASLGRHPLPDREAFAHWLADCGVGPQTQVVAYDRQGSVYACRLWWMLKWCGHEAVAVLDGGWNAWCAAGGAVASGEALPPPQRDGFSVRPPLATLRLTAEVAQALGRPSQTVVDARASARFRGETEPLDPVAGHIPGALNRPYTENFDATGRFKPAAELRQAFEALLAGRDPATVVHQCGSGVTAIPNLLAMELAGLGRSNLYAGSWSAWCNTPGLPCARG